jgi:thiamine-phosphate pyrophosphorylase
MQRRHKKQSVKRFIPRIWLMTDPRLGHNGKESGLFRAVQKLPAGSGVIFRHYHLTLEQRKALFGRLGRICRRRGHRLLLAGEADLARRWHADGFHGRSSGLSKLHSVPVHDVREIAQAQHFGADLIFLSPVFVTRSHPGTRPMGTTHFKRLSLLAAPAKVIALGGMSAQRARMLDKRYVHGWGAIDAFKR